MQPEFFEVHSRLEEVHWWFTARRRILLELSSPLLPDSGTVLDIGCGTGGNISAFPPFHRRIGVDPSPEAIAIARNKEPDVSFVCGTAPDAVASTLSVADLVLLTDVLEHVEADRDLLSALVKKMRVGAHLLLTVPADPRLWSPHDVKHGHYRRYTMDSLRALWEHEPVRVLLLAWLNWRLYPLVRIARVLTRTLRRGIGPAGTDLVLPPRPANWVLFRLFAGEGRRLSKILEGRARPPTAPGVSLIAVLEREPAAGFGAARRE